MLKHLKDITNARVSFSKPLFLYQPLPTFGSNIVVSEGNTWKKYRKIKASAFSDRNNRFLWEESLNATKDLINTVWNDKDVVEVEDVVNFTLQIALHVISDIAGFGHIRMNWQAELTVLPGHTMSFHDTSNLMSSGFTLNMAIVWWAMGMTRQLAETRTAFDADLSKGVESCAGRK
ncbi:hypothetical protein IW262DRAFT_1278161 [Armillaria fumosa]|nr:hypothetical protein IW262DRAFT_1278161 [Armillaria fumosa]